MVSDRVNPVEIEMDQTNKTDRRTFSLGALFTLVAILAVAMRLLLHQDAGKATMQALLDDRECSSLIGVRFGGQMRNADIRNREALAYIEARLRQAERIYSGAGVKYYAKFTFEDGTDHEVLIEVNDDEWLLVWPPDEPTESEWPTRRLVLDKPMPNACEELQKFLVVEHSRLAFRELVLND